MPTRFGVLIGLAVIPILSATPARADLIDYRGTGLGLWGIQINYTAGSTFQYGPGGFAGQIRLVNLTTDPLRELIAYCLDASQTLTDPQTMTLRSLSELPDGTNPPRATGGSGEQIAWLLNHFQGGGLITDNTWAAALQLAIWEVLYETSSTLSVTNGDGVFYLTNSGSYSSAANTANSMLSQLGSHTSDAIWLDWQSPTGHGQDFTTTPEPAQLLLLGSGLVGLALGLRRRQRR